VTFDQRMSTTTDLVKLGKLTSVRNAVLLSSLRFFVLLINKNITKATTYIVIANNDLIRREVMCWLVHWVAVYQFHRVY